MSEEATVPRRFLWCLGLAALVAAPLLSQPPSASAAEEYVMIDAKGCKFITSRKVEHRTVSWSGNCVSGYDEGEGTLTWSISGKPAGSYEGTMHEGREDGQGTYINENGDRYTGEFFAGHFDGRGVFTFANSNRYEGDFVKGMSTREGVLTLTDGQHFRTDLLTGDIRSSRFYLGLAALFVACFSSSEQLESLTLVRSSGRPTYDDRATEMIKVRDRIGERLVNDPIPGCHMVGAMVTSTGMFLFRSRY